METKPSSPYLELKVEFEKLHQRLLVELLAGAHRLLVHHVLELLHADGEHLGEELGAKLARVHPPLVRTRGGCARGSHDESMAESMIGRKK